MIISINPQYGNESVVAINLGTSTPKLSGSVDISMFPNLTSFISYNVLTQASNDLVGFSGYDKCPKLSYLSIDSNKIAGDFATLFPTFSTQVVTTHFWIPNNRITGSIPTNIDALTALQQFRCQLNSLSGDMFYSISKNTRLTVLDFSRCGGITGSIPSPSSCPNISLFYFGGNKLTGAIPNLSVNTRMTNATFDTNLLTGSLPTIPNSMVSFQAYSNFLTGSIPSMQGLTALQTYRCDTQLGTTKITGDVPALFSTRLNTFYCYTNQLSGFTLAPVPSSLKNFFAYNNNFTLTATWYCLSAFATMVQSFSGFVNGISLLSGGNIRLEGTNMPRLQTSAAGPINGRIYNYVNYLTSIPFPKWSVTLGSLPISG